MDVTITLCVIGEVRLDEEVARFFYNMQDKSSKAVTLACGR